MTATDMSIDLEMIADAAGVVAEAFGLGQQASPIDDWAIDDGDAAVNPGVFESTAEGNCADGIDNDCDGNTDAADPDC